MCGYALSHSRWVIEHSSLPRGKSIVQVAHDAFLTTGGFTKVSCFRMSTSGFTKVSCLLNFVDLQYCWCTGCNAHLNHLCTRNNNKLWSVGSGTLRCWVTAYCTSLQLVRLMLCSHHWFLGRLQCPPKSQYVGKISIPYKTTIKKNCSDPGYKPATGRGRSVALIFFCEVFLFVPFWYAQVCTCTCTCTWSQNQAVAKNIGTPSWVRAHLYYGKNYQYRENIHGDAAHVMFPPGKAGRFFSWPLKAADKVCWCSRQFQTCSVHILYNRKFSYTPYFRTISYTSHFVRKLVLY